MTHIATEIIIVLIYLRALLTKLVANPSHGQFDSVPIRSVMYTRSREAGRGNDEAIDLPGVPARRFVVNLRNRDIRPANPLPARYTCDTRCTSQVERSWSSMELLSLECRSATDNLASL